MAKEENIELSQRIGELKNFEIGKIRDETGSYIFSNLHDDQEKFTEFLDKFDDVYYLSVPITKIEKYKSNPAIYEILKRYEHTAEWHNLELMVFKQKELSEEQRQEALEKLKAMYPGLNIKLDDSKYIYVVGYFGGTAGRTNSYYMEEIRKIYPVKTLI